MDRNADHYSVQLLFVMSSIVFYKVPQHCSLKGCVGSGAPPCKPGREGYLGPLFAPPDRLCFCSGFPGFWTLPPELPFALLVCSVRLEDSCAWHWLAVTRLPNHYVPQSRCLTATDSAAVSIIVVVVFISPHRFAVEKTKT